ncbi:Uncharacterised protein at_DN2269 [Pycnogonum litorale]
MWPAGLGLPTPDLNDQNPNEIVHLSNPPCLQLIGWAPGTWPTFPCPVSVISALRRLKSEKVTALFSWISLLLFMNSIEYRKNAFQESSLMAIHYHISFGHDPLSRVRTDAKLKTAEQNRRRSDLKSWRVGGKCNQT